MQFKKMLIKMSQELNVHPMPGNPSCSRLSTSTSLFLALSQALPPVPTLPPFLHRIIKNQYQKLICSYIATSSDIHEAQPTLCGMTGRGRGRGRGTGGGGFMTALGPCLVTFVCDPAAMQKKNKRRKFK